MIFNHCPENARRILIVDDNPDIHADFRKVLSNDRPAQDLRDLEESIFGQADSAPEVEFALESAFGGEEAIDIVQRAHNLGRPFGMAFVDVRMPPGMDGVHTIAQIRRIDPRMQFVVCTAYSDYTPESARAKVGLSDGLLFISKPFDADIVRELATKLSSRP
jgi:CheY-like chemotaxis protein